jgi:uncharacterized protein (DUF1800 family)
MRGLPSGDIVLTKAGGARLRVSPAVIIVRVIQDMGQFPYQNPEPTGYPDRGEYWLSDWSVWNRTKFAVSLMNNEILGTNVDANQLNVTYKSDIKGDAGKKALADVMAPTKRTKAGKTEEAPTDVVNAFALALGSPEFQKK